MPPRKRTSFNPAPGDRRLRADPPSAGWLPLCLDRPLTAEQQAAADDVAVELRPDNVGVVPHAPAPGRRGGVAGLQRLAIEKRHRWPVGQRLRVRFVDGDPTVHERVAAIAGEWTRHANIAFDFVDAGDAEIRISFLQPGASWCYVGTEAAVIPPAEPTMNLGRLTAATPEEEYRRTVLHEVGHALGAVHEHPGGTAPVPWDRDATHAYCARALGWPAGHVDAAVLSRYRGDHSNSAAVDPDSIMRFPVPAELTAGGYTVPWRDALSGQDKRFIAAAYPGEEAVAQLKVGHRATTTIGCPGATDVFHFTVPAAGSYLMAADGPAAVAASLWGPDDAGILRAFDDSSGRDSGARILRRLRPGRYVFTVQHLATRALGPYQVGVHRVG